MPDTTMLKKIGSLQIDQDLQLERRFATIQRVGWIVMALAVVAALLGLLGPGPLNDRRAGEPSAGLWVEYPRFGRFQAPLTLKVHLSREAVRPPSSRVWLDRDYIQGLHLTQIVPPPATTELGGSRYIFTFPVSEPSADAMVVLTFEPEEIGAFHGILGIDGEMRVEFDQFIYP